MKIFLAGAQGVGKSTLNKMISDHLGLESVDSLSTRFIKDKSLYKDLNSREYIDMQYNIYVYAMNEYFNRDDIVSSRSIADGYAYTQYAYEQTQNQQFKRLLDAIPSFNDILHSREQVFQFYIPIEFDIDSSNPLRSTNREFQLDIDRRIHKFMDQYCQGYTTLSGSIEERFEQIIGVINVIKS